MVVAAERAIPETLPSEDEILRSYLPGILREDPFLARFLRVFDTILRPLVVTIDTMDQYLDPALTPAALLPWLGAWFGEDLPEAWPERVRRSLIREAVVIHRARGTKASLKRALELVTGCEVLITENTNGFRLDDDTMLGINTSLQNANQSTIQVVIRGGDEVDLEAVTEVIRRLKPAHAAFTVRTAGE